VDESIRVDTRLLRDHVSEVLEEKRLAQRLYSRVEQLRATSEDSQKIQYTRILNRIELLIEYYQRMADALDYVGDEAIMLYQKNAELLRRGNDEARYTVSRTFL